MDNVTAVGNRNKVEQELTMLEPTAAFRLRVNLSLRESVTSATCSGSSAAFPTMGRRIIPINPLLMGEVFASPLTESSRDTAVTVTT